MSLAAVRSVNLSTAVHNVHPNFKAAREFCGRHDTCGPNMINEIAACLWPEKYGPVGCAQMNVVVADMMKKGLFSTGGSTMSSNVQQLRDMGFTVDYPQWEHWHPEVNLAELHNLIASVDYQRCCVGLQVGQAHNLPNNEQNVFSHFVAIGGVDSALGYLVGNGDIPLPKFHGTEFVRWSDLVAANPTAVCVVHQPGSTGGGGSVSAWDALQAANWKDSASGDISQFEGVLQAPNGYKVVHGFRQFILSQPTWNAGDVPVMDQATDGTVSAQVFTQSVLEWSQTGGVQQSASRPEAQVLAYVAHLLAQAPAPAPAPAPVSQAEQDAWALIQSLAKVLREVPA